MESKEKVESFPECWHPLHLWEKEDVNTWSKMCSTHIKSLTGYDDIIFSDSNVYA